MKVTTVTGPSANNIRIQKPAQRLLIEKTNGSAFGSEMISAKITRNSGAEITITQNVYIKEIIPFVQFGNGFNPVSGGNYIAVIELSDGSPKFADGDEYNIDLAGMTNGVDYNIYAMSAPVKVSHVLKYNRASVQQGNTSKDFSTEGARLMSVSATSLTALTFVSEAGELIQLTPLELKALDLINSDFAYLGLKDADTGDSPLYVNDDYYLLNIENVERVVIDTDGSSDCAYVLMNFQDVK